MTEHVVELDLGTSWDPNTPAALLLADDVGRTVLALKPHPDDQDRRGVVVVWNGSRSSCMTDPNDEAISGHRLYAKGLSEVLWAGLVVESELVRALERQNRVHPDHDPSRFSPLSHHVLLLKECVVEVVATHVAVRRVAGTPAQAAIAESGH